MARVNLFLVHGFLGRPQDWMHVKRHLNNLANVVCYSPDLFHNENLSPHHSFIDWAQNFNIWAKSFSGPQDRNILVGYSLGGRLALHAIEKEPLFWDRSIIISSNPGFNDQSFGLDTPERQARWIQDTYWADKFLKGEWQRVILDWNAQGIFHGGGLEPQREERHYSRETLGLALTQWSLSQQKNMRPLVLREYRDIQWVVGQYDEKFKVIAEHMKTVNPDFKLHIAPNSGHRVIFDSPQFISDLLEDLISEFRQT